MSLRFYTLFVGTAVVVAVYVVVVVVVVYAAVVLVDFYAVVVVAVVYAFVLGVVCIFKCKWRKK